MTRNLLELTLSPFPIATDVRYLLERMLDGPDAGQVAGNSGPEVDTQPTTPTTEATTDG